MCGVHLSSTEHVQRILSRNMEIASARVAGRTHHQRIVVRRANRDALEPVDNQLHHLPNGLLLVLAALLKLADIFLRYLNRAPKLDDSARAELVRVEVAQSDGDDLELEV